MLSREHSILARKVGGVLTPNARMATRPSGCCEASVRESADLMIRGFAVVEAAMSTDSKKAPRGRCPSGAKACALWEVVLASFKVVTTE
jgi:hypothetical protein